MRIGSSQSSSNDMYIGNVPVPAIIENSKTITSSYTLKGNGMSIGPITVVSGAAITVPSEQRWVIF